MARVNTLTSYGSVTKSFHWLTALLILSMIPLGFFANQLAYQIKDPAIPTTGADIARVAWLFSLHKTVGVALFFTALARITWAISQPKPKLLNGDKTLEAFAATTVHWVLYSALVIVPLSGWVHHAATTGFAPIWWPFGQSLPFVPKDDLLAEQTATLHWLSCIVLVGALVLHIAGALKHHVVDKDATLRRMLPGRPVSAEPTRRQPGEALPILAALSAWAAVIFIGGSLTLVDHSVEQEVVADAAPLETVESGWVVDDGTLTISVTQFGSTVEGGFSDWTAAIDYTETPDDTGQHGTISAVINIASLTMGSVSDQAKDTDYFDLANHPTATFEADIISTETGHVAQGTLTVKDQGVPVSMPFDLTLDGDTANATGSLTVDRRDFLIGMSTQDDATLSFAVEIAFALTATRSGAKAEVETAATPDAEGWTVTEGTLDLNVSQFGSTVEGSFADWTADIDYNETPDDAGKHGTVAVTIDIASLTLGSVTADAKGPDYFDLENHPTARFEADIMATDTGHTAIGTLTVKDQTVPIEMPFDLSITDNIATASGSVALDRRDFLIGMGTTDEGTLGFEVSVSFALKAAFSDGTTHEASVPTDTSKDGWSVSDGTLGLAVSQFGSKVDGSFADWVAEIDYSQIPDADGKHGAVAVTIDIASLSLGSISADAKGPDYFDLENHPTALFEADIIETDNGPSAVGTLTIKDKSMPVDMPFDLSIIDNVATASGTLALDRRDFLIGMSTQDEGTLGFTVDVTFDLIATYN